eukprot:12430098-Karenia_brevis.AAC.1
MSMVPRSSQDREARGIKRIFGGKNMDLKLEKFEHELPGRSFRSWATDMVTFIGLIDPEVETILKETP